MATDRWRRIEEIYHAALERAAGERSAFLDKACAGDAELHQEVHSLLGYEADAQADDFLERPALQEAATALVMEAAPALREGRLGGYQILSLLGAGGMGEVYRARDIRLGREIALKVLARSNAGAPGDLRRFEDEARLASGLNHPNIVTIYGVGETLDQAYIAMELVRGRTLRQLLAAEPLSVKATLDLVVQFADALAAAHASGIVHRDLKPENLMVTPEGLLKVLDFGIAKLLGTQTVTTSVDQGQATTARSNLTEVGTILGTIGYMSPEQAAGLPADHASDQFNLGAILYEMLSRRRAFQRSTKAGTLAAIIQDEPEPIQSLNAEVPTPLREVLARCLAKDPARRYGNTRELASALRRIRDEWERDENAPGMTRRRVVWVATAAIFAGAAALATWKLWPRDTGLRSLAVLPFANTLHDEKLDYLCDGLTKSVIRGISRLPSLSVKAASAVSHFKGKGGDPREAGRLLSADAVVTGSVTRKSGRLVVTAGLVNVATGARLWSKTYDRSAADILLIQDEIARAIIEEGVRLRLSRDERRELVRNPTDDPAAYELYLRAIHLIEQGTEDAYLDARDLLRQALARDPRFALAYVALATTYSIMALDGYERSAAAMAQVSLNVRRALDADQDLPDAHSEAAVALFYLQWDWAGAEQEWNRALQSRGGGVLPNFLIARALELWALGRPNEALQLVRRARSLDPLSPRLMNTEADFLLQILQLDQAAALYERVIKTAGGAPGAEAGPAVSAAYFGLAEVRRQQKRFDEAIAARRKGHEFSGDDTMGELFAAARGAEGYREIERMTARAQLEALEARVAAADYASPLDFARAYAQLGDTERTFRYLDAALGDRSPGLVFLRVDRAWDNVREDPRFAAVVSRIGLPAPS